MSENTKFGPGIRKDPWQSGLWIPFISFLREIETVLPLEAFIRNEDFTKMFNGKQQNWGITRFLLWFLSSRSLYLFSLSGQELIFFSWHLTVIYIYLCSNVCAFYSVGLSLHHIGKRPINYNSLRSQSKSLMTENYKEK